MTIYYWKGATGTAELLDEHAESIRRIITRDYNPSDLEKLQLSKSCVIYSFRINQAARLLFTTYQRCLHVLEYLPTHDYQKSRFLQKGVLHRHLDKGGFVTLMPDEERPSFLEAFSERKPIGLDYYNQRFISLSNEQQGLLEDHRLPLIISAEPGSGKTLLSTIMLAQTKGTRALYVTEERYLVDSTRDNYLALSQQDEPAGVDFKTYHDLLGCKDQIYATDADFMRWLALQKQSRQPTAVYQEFRICSAFDKEAYCKLGKRQSSILEEDRAIFYDLYLGYLSHLKHSGDKIDPSLHPLAEHAPYDLVVVDEAQNLSLQQLLSLSRLSRKHQIVYCMDPNQNSVDVCATRVLLEVLLYEHGVTMATLSKTYRSSQRVVGAVNALLNVKRDVLGGRLDKQEASALTVDKNAPVGEFHMITPEQVDRPWVNSRLGHLAVITTQELREEALRIFGTPLVFTPKEIKGQEFHTVVVYKLLTIAPTFVQKNQSGSKHRAKNGKGDNASAPFIGSYFTACTRAMDTLMIVERNIKENSLWLEGFRAIAKSFDSEKCAAEEFNEGLVDWDELKLDQRKRGNDSVADNIEKTIAENENRGNVDTEIKTVVNGASDTKKDVKKIAKTKADKQLSEKPRKDSGAEATTKFDEALGVRLLALIMHTHICKSDLKKIKKMIEDKDFNINQTNILGDTALQSAVRYRHIDVVKAILAKPGVEVNQAYENGYTPLIYAVECRDIEISKALLAKPGIDVNQVNKFGFTALMVAVSWRCTDIVKELLKKDGIVVNQADVSGCTALILAVDRGETDIVKELLKQDGIDVNKVNNAGTTALLIAAHKGHIAIVKELLKQGGIRVNQVSKAGTTALLIAAHKGHIAIVKELLKQDGIDVNQVSKNSGFTALMCAVRCGHMDVINELLKQPGFEVNQVNKEHRTALFMALNTEKLSNLKDVLTVLLENRFVLADTIRRVIEIKNESFNEERIYVPLVFGLIREKQQVWAILKANDILGLSKEAHLALLRKIHDSKDEPESNKHPLYKVLFKSKPSGSSLFQPEVGPQISDIAALIDSLSNPSKEFEPR